MSSDESLIIELSRLFPKAVHCNVQLSQLSRWKIGGSADVIVEPSSVAELQALRSYLHTNRLPSVVIGDTSNLLFADEGLRVVCIRIGQRLSHLYISDHIVHAQAGIWVPYLARQIMLAGLEGAEHICGIPGNLGGLICMNGGSQRKGIGAAIVEVLAVGENGEIRKYNRKDCGFSYRHSLFQSTSDAIVAAQLSLSTAIDKSHVRQKMLAILKSRRQKFPRKQPNCGSVFKSNPLMYEEYGPPGALIERLGFKGYRIGDAVISNHHANFIVNAGAATAQDVIRLIQHISDSVYSQTGYRLQPEIHHVQQTGRIISPVDDSDFNCLPVDTINNKSEQS